MARRARDGVAFAVVAADVVTWIALLSLGSVGFIQDPRAMASIGLVSAVLLCPLSAGVAGARRWWVAFINALGAATLGLGIAAVVTNDWGVLAAFIIAIAAMWMTSVAHHELGSGPGRGEGVAGRRATPAAHGV